MTQQVDAVFENGVFRPDTPVSFAEGSRVRLSIEPRMRGDDSLEDLEDLLDTAYIAACRQNRRAAPSLEETRRILRSLDASLAELISRERDEH